MPMGRFIIGCVAATAVMFILGLIFYATPLQMLGYAAASDAAGASVQNALAANLPRTGTYMVPMTNSRSEEHTSELQSLMRISYAVFCLKKKNNVQYIITLLYTTIYIL